jgi:hypothetical protein
MESRIRVEISAWTRAGRPTVYQVEVIQKTEIFAIRRIYETVTIYGQETDQAKAMEIAHGLTKQISKEIGNAKRIF